MEMDVLATQLDHHCGYLCYQHLFQTKLEMWQDSNDCK